LVANGLECLAQLARDRIGPVGGGTLDHAVECGIPGIPRARETKPAQDENLDSLLVEGIGLVVDLIWNDPVRPRAVDEDIKGRSASVQGHGLDKKIQRPTGKSGVRR
jgi:hypothetical protein